MSRTRQLCGTAIRALVTLLSPLTLAATLWMRIVIRVKPFGRIENKIFTSTGVRPIADHYYQPLLDPEKHLRKSLREDRDLPGLQLNAAEQLELLGQFHYNDELLAFPLSKAGGPPVFRPTS